MPVPQGRREYKKREFCNDVQCFVQVELNKHTAGSEEYETVRKICSSACQFKADDFREWLNQKGFKVFKDGKEVAFEKVKEQCADYTGTWNLHNWMIKNGFELFKKVEG